MFTNHLLLIPRKIFFGGYIFLIINNHIQTLPILSEDEEDRLTNNQTVWSRFKKFFSSIKKNKNQGGGKLNRLFTIS